MSAVNRKKPESILSRFKFNRPLSGALNGVNVTFTTPEDFLPDTLQFFLNGVGPLDVGPGCDVTISESGGVGTGYDTVTFVHFAPGPTDKLRAHYLTSS